MEKRLLLMLALLALPSGLADTYSDVCIIDSEDVCMKLFRDWNASMRSTKGSYCTEGESHGWVQGPQLRGYIFAYLASNDTYFLNRFVEEFNGAICRPDTVTTNDCAKCPFSNETYNLTFPPEVGWYEISGWYSIDKKTRFDFIVGEGITMDAAAHFVEAVYANPALHASFKADADHYLWLMEEHLVPKWDRRGLFLNATDGGGVYLFQNHSGHRREAMSLPINQMGEMALAEMVLYRITGNDWYRARVEEIIAFFKTKWYNESGYLQWNYWDPAGPWDWFNSTTAKHGIQPDHSAGYSAIAANLVMEAYRNCMGIGSAEAQAFKEAMWHKKATKSGWYIPHSMAWLDTDAKIAVRDGLLKDPRGWGARTSGIAEFMYIMQKDEPLYPHCTQDCWPRQERCGNGFDEDCDGEDVPCRCIEADTNRDNILSHTEAANYVKRWQKGEINAVLLMEGIRSWKHGC